MFANVQNIQQLRYQLTDIQLTQYFTEKYNEILFTDTNGID
jgi:hypothetical protein